MLMRVLVSAFGSDWKLKTLCNDVQNARIKYLLVKLYGLYQYENSSAIAWNSTFLGKPYFPHGIKTIFISGGARIGRNCIIFQQVTIGSNTVPDSKGLGAPQIGDNCYIGAGAKIIGKVNIGNNVRIGANAVVYTDVPDNSVVLSGQQRTIVREEQQDNRFYCFRGRWVYFQDGNWCDVVDTAVLADLSGNATLVA